jgi:hypothetical protein
MRELRAVWSDVKNRRHLDAYVATVIAIAFATLGVIGDIVPESLKWSALFAGMAIVIFRVTLPARPRTTVEDLLGDRSDFELTPFSALIENARQVWIFAPSGINVLSAENCDAIRRKVLARADGDVKVVVLNPANSGAVLLAVRQLDDSLQFPVQDFEVSLNASIVQLGRMLGWQKPGTFGYRYLDYNPGFSLVAIDAGLKTGRVIVEFHGFQNEATSSRMHIVLTPFTSEQWFRYWVQQFEEIWQASLVPPSAAQTEDPT